MRVAIIPIWVGNEFMPINVRLIQGDNELLLRLGIIESYVWMLTSKSVTSMLGGANDMRWLEITKVASYFIAFQQLEGAKNRELFSGNRQRKD